MNSLIDYNNNLLIIISSPSGAGKTSICKKLISHDKKIKLSVSYTTRAPRDNETNGLDYFFISNDKFNSKILDNSFLEYANVFGNYYGTSKKNVEEILSKGSDVLFDIDWQGASQIINSNLARIVTIFLTPPSKDAVLERLEKRSKETGDSYDAIQKRMLEYENEMTHANEYKYVVVNENILECTEKVISIIENERIIDI
tara:strand:+ start:3777 stop:4376 length:600 start_codon:yes stop_codon:yes gene_type:complete